MVIQTEEMKKAGWRIASTNLDWQIQERGQSNGEEVWRGRNYYTTLEYAVEKAYERLLLESPLTVASVEDAVKECKRVKTSLVKAVKEAVSHD